MRAIKSKIAETLHRLFTKSPLDPQSIFEFTKNFRIVLEFIFIKVIYPGMDFRLFCRVIRITIEFTENFLKFFSFFLYNIFIQPFIRIIEGIELFKPEDFQDFPGLFGIMEDDFISVVSCKDIDPELHIRFIERRNREG